MDFQLILFDRLEMIKTVVKKYGEDKCYISFSGGKDSTVLSHLIDLAIPGNKIQRVYCDTGIELNIIREFVKGLSENDERFVIIKPNRPIKKMLEQEGYPFKSKHHCFVKYGKDKYHFHPLAVVTKEWEQWFIDKYHIKLCDIYYPPYNFTRTGCKGCPFNPTLQKDLDTLERYFPNERKQCEVIWKPVYEEYRKIGYRLKKQRQINIFDLEEKKND